MKLKRLLFSTIMLGMLVPFGATTVSAADVTLGETVTKDSQGYNDCKDSGMTYLSLSDETFACYLKRSNTKNYFSNQELSKASSKNNLIYVSNGDKSGPVTQLQAITKGGNGEKDVISTKFFIDEYVSSEDIGKKMTITIEGTNLNHKDLHAEESIVNLTQFGGIKEKNTKGSLGQEFKGTTEVHKFDSNQEIDKTVINTTVKTDSIEFEFNRPVTKVISPDSEVFKETNKWQSLDDVDMSSETSYLQMRIEVGGDVRFNGPVMAMFITDENHPLGKDILGQKFPGHNDYKLTNMTAQSSPENRTALSSFALMTNMFDTYYYPTQNAKQFTHANVINGGITGGIISESVTNPKELSIEDVDFGELKVGTPIDDLIKEKMVSVRDWTGGTGWKLTAKHKNADRNQSIQLGLQVDKDDVANLNDEEQPITEGLSQFATTQKDGKYTAKWGTHPKAGEFNNVIEWNLTANVNEE